MGGITPYSQGTFAFLIKQVEAAWPSADYDLLTRNCCHFAAFLCSRLGVKGVPDWVMRLSDVGSAISERQCLSAASVCCNQPGSLSDKGKVPGVLQHCAAP